MIVMKFGGSSVGSADSIRAIRDIVLSRFDQQPVVVVSAVGNVTNLLVELASGAANTEDIISQLYARHREIILGLWPGGNSHVEHYVDMTLSATMARAEPLHGAEQRDMVLSLGETLSSYIVSEYFKECFESRQVSSTQCLITNDRFGSAEIVDGYTEKAVKKVLVPIVKNSQIPVVTGFIGATKDGRVTTLGRGGSDYSAALLGYYVGAKEIQIWTDVDGVFSTDPRMVSSAQLIEELSYQEASELAAFGAKVLHPKTMRPAVHGNIPLRIANTFRPDAATTSIVPKVERTGEIIAVAAKKQVMMVNIYAVEMLLERGFLARISSVFESHDISIDIVSASETSVSVTLDNHEQLDDAITDLEQFSSVTLHKDVGLVSLIGQGIASAPHLLSLVFDTLGRVDITTEMISVGAQGINISLVIKRDKVIAAMNQLHSVCIEGEKS